MLVTTKTSRTNKEQVMSMVLGAVGQIHISVTDVERSVAFCRDVLGLEHLFTVSGQPMAFFQAGDVRPYLGVPANERFRSRPVVYYRVEDLDATYAAVLERGAASLEKPQKVHHDGTTSPHMAFVQDPDGNPVGLMGERPI